jgi:hypothetical protein
MSTCKSNTTRARAGVPASTFMGRRCSISKASFSAAALKPRLVRANHAALKCFALAQPTLVQTVKTAKPMNVVFVAAEVSPWSKTGGLGDVLGGLPIELAKRGHAVMTIAPRYDLCLTAPQLLFLTTCRECFCNYTHQTWKQCR